MRLVLATCLLSSLPAVAAEPSAQQFLQSIYQQYEGDHSKGVPLATDADVKRWFAPPLATLLLRDRKRAAQHHDAPELDGDPFIDAQDWQLSGLEISAVEQGPRASGNVRFVNAGTKVAIALALVRVDGHWRIADVTASQGSLVAFLKKALAH